MFERMSLLSAVWDDIDEERDLPVTACNYKPESLVNPIYRMIDDQKQRHRILRANTAPGLYSDLDKIRMHREVLITSPVINGVIQSLFPPEERESILPMDRVFLNSFYRRLIRARIERDYLERDLPKGLVIVSYSEGQSDSALVETLRLLRLVCKYLGIRSTTHPDSFDKSKLDDRHLKYWVNIAGRFIALMGENTIPPLSEENPYFGSSPMKTQEEIAAASSTVYVCLTIIFTKWSGSVLRTHQDTVYVEPAIPVVRLMDKMSPLPYE